MRRIAVPLALSLALAAPAAAKPRLTVEPGAGLSRIFVEVDAGTGQVRRSLVRVTTAPVVPGVTGEDPAGRATFATWTENGERWFSASQNGGRTWAEARAIDTALRLRVGTIEPGRPTKAVPPGLTLTADGRLFIVQFRTISLPEWRDALRNLGAEVLNYFPLNAHIVRMPPSLVPQVAGLDFVERVEPYHPSYRLEAELRDWLASENGPAEFRVRAMAFEWGPEGKERIRQAAEADGARVALDVPSGHILELWVNRGQLQRLAAHDDVLWIDRWSAPENDMDLVRQDSGANFIETNFGTCGQGVRGEVLDAGFETTHMDFDGILLHGSNTVDSHGTSTYGIVFGNGNRDGDGNAQGTGQVICSSQGIAADYDFLTDRFVHTQQLKNAPYFASFQSNSWGDALTTQYTSISNQMDDIIWRLDIAITQSQSNAGTQSSRPQAWAKNIISVGGIRHFNTLSTADDSWSGGASIGPAADGRIKPDVSYWYDSIFTTTTGNTYTTGFGGTSAATPETAGVLGLIVQMWSENVWGTNPTGTTVFERQPHASTIKALLINSAQQYPFSGTTSDLTRTHQGWGRPSARVARERAAGSLVVDQATPLQLNQSAVYSYSVPSGAADLKVTMIYPDPPGTTSSTLHRINDLSLKVTSPTGTIYNGNVGLSAGNWSTAGGSPNTIDTVENVFVQSPEAGTWTIEVRAAEINQDAHLATPAADAVFSLVATGGTAAPPICGNNLREGSEQCDGPDLGGQTCQSQGFSGGALGCNGDCTFNTSGCFVCLPLGSSCTANSQCCSNQCKGKPGSRTCK
ncbi:MAG TPA: S8 family serine peptidase [Thermoanaerobaculia bacterium]|nr:S8 family serine peptidase [Thermoanaerobaculia bacterium]